MLVYDPTLRMSAKAAVRHDYFSDVVICRPPYLTQWPTQPGQPHASVAHSERSLGSDEPSPFRLPPASHHCMNPPTIMLRCYWFAFFHIASLKYNLPNITSFCGTSTTELLPGLCPWTPVGISITRVLDEPFPFQNPGSVLRLAPSPRVDASSFHVLPFCRVHLHFSPFNCNIVPRFPEVYT